MKGMHVFTVFSLLGSALGTASAAMMVCGEHEISDDRIPGQTRAQIEEQCGTPESRSGDNLYYRKGGVSYRLHFNDSGELESIAEGQSEAGHEDVLDRVFSPLDKAVTTINRDINKDDDGSTP